MMTWAVLTEQKNNTVAWAVTRIASIQQADDESALCK